MKQLILLVLPLVFLAACTQEPASTEAMSLKAQKEKAIIDKGVQSLRIASFYIPDKQTASSDAGAITVESMAVFAKKSKLYQADELKKQPIALLNQQYQSFVKANADDPRIGQFKRETAEKMLTQNQSLAATDKAYYTRELIANRSSNLALMRTSILSLRGKIGAADYEMMVRQSEQLMDQYENHYATELAHNQDRPTETYRQRAMKALDGRYAELALNMIRENRQLIQSSVN